MSESGKGVRAGVVLLALALAGIGSASADPDAKRQVLPFLGEEARDRGIELPPPFGVGVVYYYLDRAIEITDVRVGRDGAPPASVSDFAQLDSGSRVHNANLKFDVWLLPFLNVYAIAGYLHNESTTNVRVSLPPLTPGGPPRELQFSIPTELQGTVGGLGITVAGGYGPLFLTADVNAARADLGFDEKFEAVVSSVRAGWNGRAGGRPLRIWLNATSWNTATEATGTAPDPDGGILTFEVDQGPLHEWTFGAGGSYSPRTWLDLAVDAGTDLHGGWYVAVVPVFRF